MMSAALIGAVSLGALGAPNIIKGVFVDAATGAFKGNVVYVATNGVDGATGLGGWANAKRTIQAGVNAAAAGDTVLLQRKFPSWLYSVDQGATTIWERWNSYTVKDGFGPVSMNSFNHYAYGAVAEWLFATAAGIQPDPEVPGYRHFWLAPVLDRRMGYVTARQRVPVGEIASAWRIDTDGVWTWTFTIPVGATASVVHPVTGERRGYAAGTHTTKGRL